MKLRTKMTVFLAVAFVAACGGGGGGSSSDGGGGGGGGGGGSSGYQAGPGPQGGAVLYSDFRAGKRLMLHQRDGKGVTPATLRDRLATMDVALDAFDGAFLRLPNVTDTIFKAAPVSLETIGTDLAAVYGLRPAKLRFNFAVVAVQHDLDPFDDWAPVLANVTNLARVARDAGLVGIVIDNENIAGLRANYPYDLKFQTKTIDEYRAQTQAISKQIMQAIVTEFPDAVVVVLRGAAGSEPKSPPHLVNLEIDSAQLLGPFFAGFVEGGGTRSLVVDGGTDYGLRNEDQFAASATWRKTGLPAPDTGSAFMGPAVRAKWSSTVSASFGVRDTDGARGNLLASVPLLFANTLLSALRGADNFVWASFDGTDMTRAVASDPFAAAARQAKAALASPTAHLAPTAAGSGTGLMAQYFSQIVSYAPEYVVGTELVQTVVDPSIDFDWNASGPVHTILGEQRDNFAVIWTGYLEAPVTGAYTFVSSTDDGMTVSVGQTLVVDRYGFQGETEQTGLTLNLVAGVRYPIKVRWFQGGGGAAAHVWWIPPGAMLRVPLPTERLYPVY